MPFFSLDSSVQRGSGDLEGPANLQNWVSLIVEILGNTALFSGEDFGSASSSSSRSDSGQSRSGSFPNQVSLKLRKRAKDMDESRESDQIG